ncbi:hypothetical protein Tco_1226950 [Tanacetum coccineum]
METRLEYALANGGKLEPGVLGPFKALVGWNHLAYKFKLLEELGQDCGGTVNSWYRASQAVMQCRFPYCQDGVDFKIAKFDKSAKDLNEMLESQITDKSKKGVGYNDVPSPHPLILNRSTTLDLSYSGLEEFKEPEVNEYGPGDSSLKSTTGCD